MTKRKRAFSFALIGVCFLCAFAYADMGMIPFEPEIKVFEPHQRAVIAWDGNEEILLLTTEIKTSAPSKILEVIPLPAEPQVKKGDLEVFKKATDLINEKMKAKFFRGAGDYLGTKGMTQESLTVPPAELTFHEIIGAHDISVIHLLHQEGFIAWVEKYLKESGVKNPQIPQEIKTAVAEYTKEGFSWFVFDVVSSDKEEKTRDAIAYRFKTSSLFYPLRISRAASGQTSIELVILTPYLLNNFPGMQINLSHEPFTITKEELSSLDKDMYGLLNKEKAVWLRIWRMNAMLSAFDKDLVATKELPERIRPRPEAFPRGAPIKENLKISVGSSVILDDFKMKLSVLKIKDSSCLFQITFSEKEKFAGTPKDYSQYAYDNFKPVTLYRNVRNCANNDFCPGTAKNQIIDLKSYGNYKCRPRYNEQCIADGSFDCYYEEFCDYAPVWLEKGKSENVNLLKINLVDTGSDFGVFDIIYLGEPSYPYYDYNSLPRGK